jgi:WD40 repeat protein
MKHLVITVHGIRTFGDWQERLEDLLVRQTAGRDVTIEHYKFGYFSVIAFVVPLLRWLVVRRFRRYFLQRIESDKWDRIDVIAHSFGTHLVSWGLYRTPARRRPKIDTLILAGSVLKSTFPWQQLHGSSVKRVVNDCGLRDKVLILSQFVVLFTGMAGRMGFSGGTGRTFRNRYFNFGHSGYFFSSGKADNAFMLKYWLPLIAGESELEPVQIPQMNLLNGAFATLSNNVEPLKLAVYLAPMVLFGYWVSGLYIDVQKRQSLFLADRAEQLSASGDHTTAMLIALEGLPRPESWSLFSPLHPHVPEAEQSLQAAVLQQRERRVFWGHAAGVWSAEFGPQGDMFVTASEDKTARIWRPGDSSTFVPLVGHGDRVWRAVFNPAGDRIATASEDRTARLWTTDGDPLETLAGHTGWVTGVAFSPDGRLLATSSEDATARVWTRNGGGEGWDYKVFAGHAASVRSVGFDSQGRWLLTASEDRTVRIWDVASQTLVKSFEGHTAIVNGARFNADATLIVTASEDKTARLWDLRPGATTDPVIFRGHEGRVHSARFNPQGDQVVTASEDKTARVWDVRTGRQIGVLRGHTQGVVDATFSPDGRSIVTVSEDNSARLWWAPLVQETARLQGHTALVEAARFSPDGSHVVTASWDQTARLWRLRPNGEAELERVLTRSGAKIRSAAFDPAGSRIVTASNDKLAHVTPLAEGAPAVRLEGHGDWLTGAVFSPDGRSVATSSWDRTVGLWDAETGKLRLTLSGHERGVTQVAFSHDARHVATSSSDRTARLWDAQTGQPLRVFTAPDAGVNAVAFSPNDRCLATGSDDGAVRLWNTENGRLIATLRRHKDSVRAVGFSGDGSFLVSGSDDRTARVWQTSTGRETAVLRGHDGAVFGASFSPSEPLVLTASYDGTARLWRYERLGAGQAATPYAICSGSAPRAGPGRSELLLSSQELISHARETVPRCLSAEQRKEFFLTEGTPTWCIAMGKWPHHYTLLPRTYWDVTRDLALSGYHRGKAWLERYRSGK